MQINHERVPRARGGAVVDRRVRGGDDGVLKDTIRPVDPSGMPIHKVSRKVSGKEEAASAADAESA